MSPFIGSIVSQLESKGIKADVLDTAEWNLYKKGYISKKLISKNIKIRYIQKFIKIIKLSLSLNQLQKYDTIVIFYLQDWIKYCAFLLKKKTKNIIISYAGSDYYRVSDKKKRSQKKLINHCTRIIFNNKSTKDSFLEFHENEYHNKVKLTGLGIDLLPLIDKNLNNYNINLIRKKFLIPDDSIIITIGYSASEAQQHKEVFKLINNIPTKNKLFILLPLTYGGNIMYKNDLIERLEKNKIQFYAFTNYLSNEELAEIRAVSDITINMQTSDQASHSLLEHLFAQDIVLVGEWLPYTFWDEMGVYYHKVNKNNLLDTLAYIIENLNDVKQLCLPNKDKVEKEWLWDYRIDRWINALNLNNL